LKEYLKGGSSIRTPRTINKAECQKALTSEKLKQALSQQKGRFVSALQGQGKSHNYWHWVPTHPSVFSSFIIPAAYSKASEL